jgi:hypothetical protein
MRVGVTGLSPLLVHQWSEKAQRQILERQQKRASAAREARDPKAEFEASKYLDAEGRDCFPARNFKAAIVAAASFADGCTKVHLRGALFVVGDLLPLGFARCTMRQDCVRLAGPGGTADLRFRAQYDDWSVDLPVQFNGRVISAEQIVHLLNVAGFHVGVGEWRPAGKQSTGDFGRFQVKA